MLASAHGRAGRRLAERAVAIGERGTAATTSPKRRGCSAAGSTPVPSGWSKTVKNQGTPVLLPVK